MARKSQVRIEYEKQLKRVQGIVKRGIKKGITFTESPIPETPKRVTRKRVEELKELTYREIWSKGYTINPETGEMTQYSPYEASKEASRKRQETITAKKNKHPNKDDIIDWVWNDNDSKESSKDDITIIDYDWNKNDDIIDYDWVDDDLEHVTADGRTYAIDPDTGEILYDIPLQRDELLHYFEEAISGGTNPATSALIYEIYKAEIDEAGEDEVAKRIANSTHEIRTLAEEVAHAYYSDEIRENAVALLNIITAGNYTPWTLERLDETTYQDRPNKHRQSSNRAFYHIAKHVKGWDGDDD